MKKIIIIKHSPAYVDPLVSDARVDKDNGIYKINTCTCSSKHPRWPDAMLSPKSHTGRARAVLTVRDQCPYVI